MAAELNSPMEQLSYEIRFVTPAFLGDAEQNGAWRTPPFKALLRQWWRVAAAREHDYSHRALRETEGRLFGNAWLEPKNGQSQFCKSRILLRLDPWSMGNLSSDRWPGGPMEKVMTTRDAKGPGISADLYMGYGPVLPPNKRDGRTRITIRNAIDPADSARLRIGVESELKTDVAAVLQLIQWFGSMGSRSRNGWGSLELEPYQNAPALRPIPQPNDIVLTRCSRPWQECFRAEWPHALGADIGKPLIWISEPQHDWRKVMGCLANVKVAVRLAAKSFRGPFGIGGIHFLGYPAGGKWELKKLGKEARLASQLRFKIIRKERDFFGMVFHLPCRFPDALRMKLDDGQIGWIEQNELLVWEKIHSTLHNNRRVKPLF